MILLWRRARSRRWPMVVGTVVHCQFEKHGYGGDFALLQYKYKVDGERSHGVIKKPYIYPNDADAFVRHHPADMELSSSSTP